MDRLVAKVASVTELCTSQDECCEALSTLAAEIESLISQSSLSTDIVQEWSAGAVQVGIAGIRREAGASGTLKGHEQKYVYDDLEDLYL